VNPWLIAALIIAATIAASGTLCMRGALMERLVALEVVGVLTTLLIVVFAELFKRPELMDLAIATGLLGFGGGLVFLRFFERWL
jgi:multisubunit Na+/H+ antiporter MnhF subunit